MSFFDVVKLIRVTLPQDLHLLNKFSLLQPLFDRSMWSDKNVFKAVWVPKIPGFAHDLLNNSQTCHCLLTGRLPGFFSEPFSAILLASIFGFSPSSSRISLTLSFISSFVSSLKLKIIKFLVRSSSATTFLTTVFRTFLSITLVVDFY